MLSVKTGSLANTLLKDKRIISILKYNNNAVCSETSFQVLRIEKKSGLNSPRKAQLHSTFPFVNQSRKIFE